METGNNREASASLLDDVSHFYSEHKTAVNTLCLLGIAAIGGAKLVGKAVRPAPEVVFGVGTKEFDELAKAAKVVSSDTQPIKFKTGYGDPMIFVAPSKSRGASKWDVTIPDIAETVKHTPNPFGKGVDEVITYRDVTVSQDHRLFEISKAGDRKVVLNRTVGTGEVYGPEGNLLMHLDSHGNEWHYSRSGEPLGIMRGVHRSVDLMGWFK